MSLAPELMHIVGLMLPLSSIVSLMCVNRKWYRVLNTNHFWRDLYRRDFPFNPSERTLKYNDRTEELFLHPEEIHYETLYRLSSITHPYLEAGREELSETLKKVFTKIGKFHVTFVSSAKEQLQQRIALHGERAASVDNYMEGYSHLFQWKIEFIHCVHPLNWVESSRCIQRDDRSCYEHIGYRLASDLRELTLTATYYHRDDRWYFYIHHVAWYAEQAPFGAIIPIPLTSVEDVKLYIDAMLEKGYVPVDRRVTMSDKDQEDYHNILGLAGVE